MPTRQKSFCLKALQLKFLRLRHLWCLFNSHQWRPLKKNSSQPIPIATTNRCCCCCYCFFFFFWWWWRFPLCSRWPTSSASSSADLCSRKWGYFIHVTSHFKWNFMMLKMATWMSEWGWWKIGFTSKYSFTWMESTCRLCVFKWHMPGIFCRDNNTIHVKYNNGLRWPPLWLEQSGHQLLTSQ